MNPKCHNPHGENKNADWSFASVPSDCNRGKTLGAQAGTARLRMMSGSIATVAW
jgi:hypothetical protein